MQLGVKAKEKKREVKVTKNSWRSLVEVSPGDNHRHPPPRLKPTLHTTQHLQWRHRVTGHGSITFLEVRHK